MHRIKHLTLAAAYTLLLGLGLMPAVYNSVTAATPTPQSTANNGQALEIAPPVINLSADPGQTIKTQILLRNVSKGTLIVSGQANDFVAAGEDGTPKVLLNEEPTSNNPYSLKNWVNPPASLTIAAREIKTMEITINVPSNASPGGHYGVIRFTATAPSLQGTGVSLSASLGSLILLSVNGNVKESLAIKEFSATHGGKTGSLFESGPINFLVRLTNNGNVHEQPVGQVIVKNMFGKKIASTNVNLPPKNILPQSTRRFIAPLDKTVIGDKKLFGRYTANLTVTYGKNKQTTTSSLVFWVIPIKTVAILITFLILLFFALRYFIKWYNRRVIRKSNK
jgi:hypothetical protein